MYPLDPSTLARFESQKKSPGIAIILAFIFGPFGTFYSSAMAGTVMCFAFLFATLGGVMGLAIASLVNMCVAGFMASEHNENLMAQMYIAQEEQKKNPNYEPPKEEYDFAGGF